MVEALDKMELVDKTIKLLGEEGIIPPLLEMVSGKFEAKHIALSALSKISSCRENKKLIATAGGIPLVLEQMFSSPASSHIIAKCSEFIRKLSSNGDGIEFFVDANGSCLDLEKIITNLLVFQQNSNTSYTVRKPSLYALLGICNSKDSHVLRAAVSSNGVSIILPLLDEPDQEVREVALTLLFLLSQNEPQGIVNFLLMHRRLEALVGFLEDDSRSDAQIAAVGLLANLPKSEVELTRKLIELNGLQAIVKILKSGTIEAKENALGALFRFTAPTNHELQRMVVEKGTYPLFLDFLKSESITAKARAVAHIGNLSMSSPELTVMYKPTGCGCFGRARDPLCDAHGGICDVGTTFCLLKANALPELVRLLQEQVPQTAYEVLPTLSTLLQDNSFHRGAKVLHDANAIVPVLEVLKWGTSDLKEEALSLLEKVFSIKELTELYGSRAKLYLRPLTTRSIREDDHLGRRVTRVMAQLERYSKSSMPLV